MKFYVGTQRVEYNGKNLYLATKINESDIECIKPLLETISGLEIWEDENIVELTSAIDSNSGLLPMDIVFLTNFSEYVETHNQWVEIMELGILKYRLILAKFDSFNSLFVEKQQLNDFIKDLSTNSKGRYNYRRKVT